MTSLPASLRRAQILEQIQARGGATVAELARDHAVSTMTAHRDLEQLAREGLVERVRGGARALAPEAGPHAHPTAWDHRVGVASAAKRAIAEEAATLIVPGSTVFLDASSSALALARRLTEDPPYELTLVTNSPMIAAEVRAEQLHVVVCPGELDQHTRTVAGRWTLEFLRGLRLDTAFVSAAGITLEAGLTTSRGVARRRVQRRARRVRAHRRAGRRDEVRPRVARVDRRRARAGPVITDDGLDPAVAAAFGQNQARG